MLTELTIETHGLLDLLSLYESLLVLALYLISEGLVTQSYALAASVRSNEKDLYFFFSCHASKQTFK